MLSRFNLTLFLLAFCFSCAKTPEQEIISAKKEALYFLTEGDCSSAKSALDAITPESDDASYYSLYASVYQCFAGVKQLDIISDLASLVSPTTTSLWGTFAAFNLASVETEADSTSYTNTMLAINKLLNAGGGSQPSAVNRQSVFGINPAGELDLQVLLLITVEFGKFLNHYGQSDETGVKGAGNGNAGCLAEYTDTNARDAAQASTACTNHGTESTLDMRTANADYIRRLCEGVVLFNNFQDVLSNLTFSSNSSELADLSDVGALLTTLENLVSSDTPSQGYVNITGQAACETLATTNQIGLERFFAVIIDGNY
jgi:hypothetical protein